VLNGRKEPPWNVDHDQACGFFGSSLCTNSGHRSSISSHRIGDSLDALERENFLVYPLNLVGHDDPAVQRMLYRCEFDCEPSLIRRPPS
jgi:hypothetical protein